MASRHEVLRGRKKKFIKTKVFLLISCIALGLLVFFASPFFYIENIEIEGVYSCSRDKLLNEINIGPADSIFYKTNASIKKSLESLPYIRWASVKKVYPNTIVITVSERIARGCVEDAAIGVYLYIDEEGYVLDVKTYPAEGLPVMTGLSFSGYTIGAPLSTDNKEAFTNVVRLTALFSKYAIMDVSRVDVSDSTNIRLYIGNLEVLIGSIKDADIKINTALAYLADAGLDKNLPGTMYAADPDFSYLRFK